tara:strand:+ start:658 stop:1320 length:663 start_codon:yes stop_codon:yes gene_type:complete
MLGVNMGLFNGIKSAYKKSEAILVVKKLLEHKARIGLFYLEPSSLAESLVEVEWSSKPDIYNGKFGQWPHKISVAASALANGIWSISEPNKSAIILSLGDIFAELEVNRRLFPLNSLDDELLESSMSTYFFNVQIHTDLSDLCKLDKPPTHEESLSWDDWYQIFKNEAGIANPQLETSDGLSILDLMESESIKKAYIERVDPKYFARDFAKHFDIKNVRM